MTSKKSRTVLCMAFVCVGILIYGYVHRWAGPYRYIAPVRDNTKPYNHLLVAAAGRGDIVTVKRLLAHGINPNAADDSDENALMTATNAGHLAVVQLLLDKGADVNAPDVWGATALTSASFDGDTEIVRLLLSRGADVDASDDDVTALAYARAQKHPEIVKMLEQAGSR